jgi:serine/threonine protein kinase
LTDGTAQSPRQVYLIDFGSAQTSLTGGTITIVGTYGYMPPEQFGRRALPASDLYALGATLIYLATGQEPSELLQKDMRILFDKRVNLDRDFVDWLKRMTEPSLDLRLDSAQKALEALESAPRRKLTLPITAKPISSEIPIANAMSTIRLAMTYNLFSASLYLLSLVLWNHGGWFLALLAIYYLGNGLFLIASILYANSKEIQHQLAKSS